MKRNSLVGCCGISCGLCPRFQSKAKSRCLGCGPDPHCSHCSIYRCCAMKQGYEVCSYCPDFPCKRFDKWFDKDSFVTHKKCLTNLREIKIEGIRTFMREQKERKDLLEIALDRYNPGRCMSMYCLASALLHIKSFKGALRQIEKVKEDKPQVFKKLVQEIAEKDEVAIILRK